tara:strand:- start:32 stop:364 length:333 start_codon:yes stop_codon:yes gene_type:complete
MFVGGVGGVLVVLSITLLDKLKLDDPVGAISVHGTAGMWGLMAVLITTEGASFVGQISGLLVIFGWTFIISLIVWYVIKLMMGIRLSPEEEEAGSDATDIGVAAYPEFKV